MLYELRIYQPNRGRLPDLLTRFRDRIPALFARHSIRCQGQWLVEGVSEGESARFAYLTVYDDYAHREAAWNGFSTDPEWHEVRRKSNGPTEMLRGYDLYLLRPKRWCALPEGAFPTNGMYELLFQHTLHGQDAVVDEWLLNVAVPELHAAGAASVGCFDLVAGAALPQGALLVHWPRDLPPGGAEGILRTCIRSPFASNEVVPALANIRCLALRPALA